MNIEQRLLTINPYSRPGRKLQSQSYIIIHYVGNPNTSALANRNYFENLKNTHKTYASSQYIVGLQGEIIECIPPDEEAFHSGNSTMNKNSIGIEVCHPTVDGYFTDITTKSLSELVQFLMKTYSIDSDHIIRHYDVTGKPCPKYYVDNIRWQKLKETLIGSTEIAPQPINNKVLYKNGSTSETVYSNSSLTNKIGSLAKYERCYAIGAANGRYIVRYVISGTSNYKVGFVKYNGGVRSVSENVKIYCNGNTTEPVYADSNCTKQIGSLDRYEKCECIEIFNNVYVVKYKINNTSTYKVGFVKYSGGVK